MARGIAIHIGVNQPASPRQARLSLSEENAWKMAELSYQAGYGAIHLLRGADATCAAVRSLLSAAAGALKPRHTLLVSFSGHGRRVPDMNRDERDGWDETWCLHDANLVDDELLEIWKIAATGARVLVVSESCFAGGMRYGDDVLAERPQAPYRPVYRTPGPVLRGVPQYAATAPRISTPAHDEGIRASVLVLAGASETQTAREGLYTRCMLELWSGGEFRESFQVLQQRLRERVQNENPGQEPQMVMLGTPNSGLPLEPAFHLGGAAMRGGMRG
jgi:hypothetical protein